MKKTYMILSALLPMMAAAQTVKSPNGNVSLTFSLTDKGQPTYEMTYKGIHLRRDLATRVGRDINHPKQLQRDGCQPSPTLLRPRHHHTFPCV